MTRREKDGLIAERLLETSIRMGLRVAVAESLTGGLLADAFVKVSGASHAFLGAIVAYETSLKRTLLGVEPSLLADRGPVDGEVAKQMARGVRSACAAQDESMQICPADIGIATTGVAGPDPDLQSGQQPGTVWLGISSVRGERAVLLHLSGSRDEVRTAAVEAALEQLALELDELQNGQLPSETTQEM